MKISKNWLQTYFDTSLPNDEAISDALTFHAFEIDGVEHVASGTSIQGSGDPTDSIFDVKITANRGHDCLSHRGIAKELSVILNLPLQNDPLLEKPNVSHLTEKVEVKIESDLCRRYIAAYVGGVKVGPSPDWLRARLEAMGQRSINNVVDATNFVMFNTGQPLHAFDASKLGQENGKYKILVRTATAGETLQALDEKEYALTESNLLIVDGVKNIPIGIAGVKGGMPAGISESTTDIIIESANFAGPSVRRTAQQLKLRTDASSRYEQEIVPELAAYGMVEVVKLIADVAGGTLDGYVDIFPAPTVHNSVLVTLSQINKTLGTDFEMDKVLDVFTRLGMIVAQTPSTDEIIVVPPIERLDIVIPEDLIEEVGRIIGYDAVPAIELPQSDIAPAVNHQFYTIEFLRNFLVERGFSEVYTSVFTESGEQVVANKVDGVKPYLRDSLMSQLEDALEKNIRNKDIVGIDQIKIFEIGTVWYERAEHMHIAIAVEKIKKHDSIDAFIDVLEKGAAVNMSHTTKTTTAVEIPLELFENALMLTDSYDDFPVSQTERYKTFSKYPAIVRDVSLWSPAGTTIEEVQNEIKMYGGELLTSIRLFDQFEKEGRVSYAFRMVFQSMDRTLFEEDANTHMESITLALKAKGWEVR
jgi:phenylalanyl-tRNA synthetase beta chain